ncbi:hypothetical protein RQP46_005568 [Phenoliferia psychrophenolica]
MLASSVLGFALFALVPFAAASNARSMRPPTALELLVRSRACNGDANCSLTSVLEMLNKRQAGPSQRARAKRSEVILEQQIEKRQGPSQRARAARAEVVLDKRQAPSQRARRRSGIDIIQEREDDSSSSTERKREMVVLSPPADTSDVCPRNFKACEIENSGNFECIGVWESCY